MTIFLFKVFRAAIALMLLAFITGCSPGKNLNGAPTPTPTPTTGASGNAFVYTADAGDNTISGFANDSTGTLTPVPGSPFISAGAPFGMAATSDNKFLYVSSFQNNVVTGFSVSTTTGSLTPLSCPLPAATGVQPLKIDINPAGTFLYTANQGGGTGNG
ncbi:MAG: beta-propeller fold lactonase family protein, partial [Candidatus Angelobacter sp.]